jgi:hypothetical protein
MNFLISLRKIMTIVKDGVELWLFNCARLDDATDVQVGTLGTVTNIVSMSSHSHHDAYFQERFHAKLWTIQGLTYEAQDNVQCEYFDKDTIFLLEGASNLW